MSNENMLDQLGAHAFTCPESVDIAAHILATLTAVPPTDDDVPFVGYAVSVPFYVETIWKAAREQGQEAELRPVLDHIKRYFLADADVVPDHHGAIGLLDDAYVVYLYIDRLNARYGEAVGEPLADIQVDYQLQMMAGHLGEEAASRIEAVVNRRLGEKEDGDEDEPEFDLQTVGKYVLGGLAGMFLAKTLMSGAQPSSGDRWMSVMDSQIRNGW